MMESEGLIFITFLLNCDIVPLFEERFSSNYSYSLHGLYFRLESRMSATRALLSTSRLMVVPRRGKALANWARPSIDEMGVPTESWKQVYIH